MTAYREMEDTKPEKAPKTPKESKVKELKQTENFARDINQDHSSTKTSPGKSPNADVPLVRFVAKADAVNVVNTGMSEGSSQPSHHDIINVVDDAPVSPGHQTLATTVSGSVTSSSNNIQMFNSPPLQHRPYARRSKSPQKTKVSTPKPKAQYPAAIIAAQYRPQRPSVSFAAGAGIQALYPVNQQAMTTQTVTSGSGSHLGTPVPAVPFSAQYMFPRHTSPYKQHAPVQTVPPYARTSYNSAISTQFNTQSPPTSYVATLSTAPVYTQAYKSPGTSMTSTDDAVGGFLSGRPAVTVTSQHADVTQPLQYQSYTPGFVAGYPTMNYARPEFGRQTALMNNYQMLSSGQQGQHGLGPAAQPLPQNLPSQGVQRQPNHFLFQYGRSRFLNCSEFIALQ